MLWFFFALAGAFLMAIYFLEMKKLVANMDQDVIAGVVFFVSGTLFLIISLINGLPETGPDFAFAVIGSVTVNSIATVLYLRALKLTDLSLAVPMIAFTPLFLIFTSSLMLDEAPHPDGIAGILLVVAGSYVLNFNAHHDVLYPFQELFRNRGMFYMLIVSVLLSFLANFDKMVMLNSDFFLGPGTAITLTGAVFLGHAFLRRHPVVKETRKNAKGLAIAIGTVLLSILFVQVAWSIQIVPYVISIHRLSILFSVILGGVLLHEKGMLNRLAGALLMVAGAAIIILSDAGL